MGDDRSRNRDATNGDPTSLYGRINTRDFGSNASVPSAPSLPSTSVPTSHKPPKQSKSLLKPRTNVLTATDAMLEYTPQTLETKQIYALLLAFVQGMLGDVSSDVVAGGCDVVIGILKDECVKDFDKKREIEGLLGQLHQDKFSQLVSLGKKITDFARSEGEVEGEDEYGVAVLFDEEEEEAQDEEEESDVYEEDQDHEAIVYSEDEDDKPKQPKALSIQDVDAFYMQRLVGETFEDPIVAQRKAAECLAVMRGNGGEKACENGLVEVFEYCSFGVVKFLVVNRGVILQALDGQQLEEETHDTQDAMDVDHGKRETIEKKYTPKPVDLDTLKFAQGSHQMSNKTCILPPGSTKRSQKGYEEIRVPAVKSLGSGQGERVVMVSEMPEWARDAFTGSERLNRVQSKVFEGAFQGDGNLLICAPTGAGKTNVAMLTMLREIGKHIATQLPLSPLALTQFKIVYIAPMKALVSEMVRTFSTRFAAYNISVAELTGDRQLTKEQIRETQVIVTTPEKWDVVTRKGGDASYLKLVRLVIIDEVHLLHDDRGPVLESIVIRTLHSTSPTRLVALSATLPNYPDVASFLNVPPSNLFFFDSTYRPCPLHSTFIGLTSKKPLQRYQQMNQVCYDKILENANKHQSIVFVHSRKDTSKTAFGFRDLAIDRGELSQFTHISESLTQAALVAQNQELRELLPYAFGIHHAGLSREDRTLVETLFLEGHVQVLVSTATLAWGVNLPAHTVVIKGTQVYSPEKGEWVELSPQDVLQMLGRAGRPQFDTFGEGIIITTHQELQYYLSLLTTQLPIESQLISKLPDTLNAEIVLGTVTCLDEAVEWLGDSYLQVRMTKHPQLYGIAKEEYEEDTNLTRKRCDLSHAGLVRYDQKTGAIQSTDIGRIASHFYITAESMQTYMQHLTPHTTPLDLLHIFSLSSEFKDIPLRASEQPELVKLYTLVPHPIRTPVTSASSKINVLLQAWISQLKLEGFALMADMVYVTQSAGRILRGLFEICLAKGWAGVTRHALEMCKMVALRMWGSMNPLRQFKGMAMDVIRKLERKAFPWERYFDLNPQELGELAGIPKAGKTIHRFVHMFPRLDLQAYIQPLTSTLISISLTLTPDFTMDPDSPPLLFHIITENTDSTHILHHVPFILHARYASVAHTLTYTVEITDPMPPHYYVSVVSDTWLKGETRLAVGFRHMIMPGKFKACSDMLDMAPMTREAFHGEEGNTYTVFTSVQTQVFRQLYETDESTFIGAPCGSGLDRCVEFALMRLWRFHAGAKCVILVHSPYQLSDFAVHLSARFPTKHTVVLEGDGDVKKIERGDVLVCTGKVWEKASRRWRQRRGVQAVGLVVVRDVQMVGGEGGDALEVCLSRTRFMATQLDKHIRILALSPPLATAHPLAEWLGCPSSHIHNFHPSTREHPLQITLQPYTITHHPSLVLAMIPATLKAVSTGGVVFVGSRKECGVLAEAFVAARESHPREANQVQVTKEFQETKGNAFQDKSLARLLTYGIVIMHDSLSDADLALSKSLFTQNHAHLLILTKDLSWSTTGIQSTHVVVMGTQFYHGREHRYKDYPLTELLQMQTVCASLLTVPSRFTVMHPATSTGLRRFLYEPVPVESHLDQCLHDYFNAEVGTGTIESRQDAVDYLTWTYFYRRLGMNPNYYNLQGDAATQKVDSTHLSDHLSELTEQTLEDLHASKCISLTATTLTPQNLGMIAAYYAISYTTLELLSLSLTPKTKMRGLLEIITAASEFEGVAIRHHEGAVLKRIGERVPIPPTTSLMDPHGKTNVLLQAHFTRLQLPMDLHLDLQGVLPLLPALINATVDVLASHGYLLPAIAAMEFSQMTIQGILDRDSPLRQLPHLTPELIEKLGEMDVSNVFEFMEMDDSVRSGVLGMDTTRMGDIARWVNRYPNISLNYDISDTTSQSGDTLTLRVLLERDSDDNDDTQAASQEGPGDVIAPFFPGKRAEGWWIVIGDPRTKTLLAVKKVNLAKRLQVSVGFTVPEVEKGDGDGENVGFKLYLICDSYAGCDQEYEFEVLVRAGEEEGEEGGEAMEVDE